MEGANEEQNVKIKDLEATVNECKLALDSWSRETEKMQSELCELWASNEKSDAAVNEIEKTASWLKPTNLKDTLMHIPASMQKVTEMVNALGKDVNAVAVKVETMSVNEPDGCHQKMLSDLVNLRMHVEALSFSCGGIECATDEKVGMVMIVNVAKELDQLRAQIGKLAEQIEEHEVDDDEARCNRLKRRERSRAWNPRA